MGREHDRDTHFMPGVTAVEEACGRARMIFNLPTVKVFAKEHIDEHKHPATSLKLAMLGTAM